MTFEEASYLANQANYQSFNNGLAVITNNYNAALNDAGVFYASAATNQSTADLSINIMNGTAYKLFSLNASNDIKLAEGKVLDAKAALEGTRTYSIYVPYLYPDGWAAVYYGYQTHYYDTAVTKLNYYKDLLVGYDSWSFSISFNISGGVPFSVSESTIGILIDLTLKLAEEIGIISTSLYTKISGNPLYKMALVSSVTSGLESQFNVVVDNSFSIDSLKKILDVRGIDLSLNIDDLSVENSNTDIYNNAVEELRTSQSNVRSKHSAENRYMVLDTLMTREEKKYNRIAYQRILNSEYKEKYGDSVYSR